MFRVFYGLFSILVPDVTTSSNVHTQGHSVELEPAAICSNSPLFLLRSYWIPKRFSSHCLTEAVWGLEVVFYSFIAFFYNFLFSVFNTTTHFSFSHRCYVWNLCPKRINTVDIHAGFFVFVFFLPFFSLLHAFSKFNCLCWNFSSGLQNQSNFLWLWNFLKKLEDGKYFASYLCVFTPVKSYSIFVRCNIWTTVSGISAL